MDKIKQIMKGSKNARIIEEIEFLVSVNFLQLLRKW